MIVNQSIQGGSVTKKKDDEHPAVGPVDIDVGKLLGGQGGHGW